MIVCVLERPELDRLGAGHGDLEGIIDQLRLTRDIEVALLASASDTEANTYKFSMRSNHFVDVAAVAGKFGGGGHVRAAGASFNCGMEKAKAAMMQAALEQYHAAK